MGTNLTDVSELENYTNLEYVYLSDNLLTDVSSLESLENIKMLDISNNSIGSFNIEAFPNLMSIDIEGNYNLYTDEIVDYCSEHNIAIDIDKEDVKSVEQLKEVEAKINKTAKTDKEKEKNIYKYVMDTMVYDMDALENEDLVFEYNENALQHAVKGKGVCATYATYFDAMCELSGINCYYLSGYAKGGPHAWNLVEIDGDYMLCDVTWADSANDSFLGLGTAKYYNKTGSSAKKFIKQHEEGTFEKSDIPTNIRNNMVFHENTQPQKETLEEENTIELKEESEEQTEVKENGILNKITKIIEGIDTSKVDKDKLVQVVLSGIMAGGIVLLSKKMKESLKKSLAKAKERKQRRKEIKELEKELEQKEKERKEFRKQAELKRQEQLLQKQEQELKKQEELLQKEPEPKKEPQLEEILESDIDPRIKMDAIDRKQQELLRTAAIEKITVDSSGKIDEPTEEQINEKKQELLNEMTLKPEERLLNRIKKAHPDYDNYPPSYQETARSYAIIKHMNIDSLMSKYNELQAEKIINGMEAGIITENNEMEETNTRVMGYSKIIIISILTFIFSVGIIILGMLLR